MDKSRKKLRRVAVTGGNGFIGQHLIEKLLREGASVLNISRYINVGQHENLNCEHEAIDIRNANQVTQTLKKFKPETVFHMASMPDNKENYGHAIDSVEHNLIGTINVLEAFSLLPNAKKFVYGDSVKVYGNTAPPYQSSSLLEPNSSYAISKLAGWSFCELYARNNEFNAISVRPTLVYGHRQPINIIQFVIDSILDGKEEISLMGGSQTRAPLYIDDAVNAYLYAEKIAGERNLQTMIVSGDREISVIDLATQISEIMESKIKIFEQEQNRRETEIMRSYVNLEQTYEQYSWRPKHSLKEGLVMTIEQVQHERTMCSTLATNSNISTINLQKGI